MIVIGLLLGAALFAWGRSRHRPRPGADVGTATAGALAFGRSVYTTECGSCHGNGPADRAGVAGSADDMYRADGGAVMLVDFLLFGAEAATEDDIDHPSFGHLPDTQIAALCEYLLAYGPPASAAGGRLPIAPDDVAARREGR
jgi:mono/diheme cytochrome c family protein